LPPTVNEPLLEPLLAFGATVKLIARGPVPLAGETEIQELLLVAEYEHVDPVVKLTLEFVPDDGALMEELASVNEQALSG
jgi:hypothetical protein